MNMASFGECNNTKDKVSLCASHCLYLKPIARINITTQIPPMKQFGNSISNWDVMESIKKLIRPNTFIFLKVLTTNKEFIRFEGELDDKSLISRVIHQLEGKFIKLSGYHEALKVKAAEVKSTCPTRHDWDAYFRDAKNMDEMKPGERPDTIFFKDLPTRWFASPSAGQRLASSTAFNCQKCKDIVGVSSHQNGAHQVAYPDSDHQKSSTTATCSNCELSKKNGNKVSEITLTEVMQVYGLIRRVHIPCLDPYSKQEIENAKKLDPSQFYLQGKNRIDSVKSEMLFNAYVQYDGYIGFDRAMNSLKDKKLLLLINGNSLTANISITYDKTKHMSDVSVKKRQDDIERVRKIIEKRDETAAFLKKEEIAKLQALKKKREEENAILQEKRELRKAKREERSTLRKDKRRQRLLSEQKRREEIDMLHRIEVEERRILIANRKLETIRLLPELFHRIKQDKQREEVISREADAERERVKQVRKLLREQNEAKKKIEIETKRKKLESEAKECRLRNKILHNVKACSELKEEKKRELLRFQTTQNGTKLNSSIVIPELKHFKM